MAFLSILPAEHPVPLDDLGAASAVAVVRPFDDVEYAEWQDRVQAARAAGRATGFNSAVRELMRGRLVRIENLEVRYPDGSTKPFDIADEAHMRSLPVSTWEFLLASLLVRARLTEEQRGN